MVTNIYRVAAIKTPPDHVGREKMKTRGSAQRKRGSSMKDDDERPGRISNRLYLAENR